MEIRRLQPLDLDTLLSVRDGIFDEPIAPAQASAFLASPLHHLFMVFENGQALAFASGTVLLHPDKPPCLFINEVGTHEDHRRRGHASAVTRALIDHARSLGCTGGVWLATEPDNDAARALYRSMGASELPATCYGWDGAFD
ncbi:MAG: GNAT family N-acetyltransferase [Pararhodobacter sp.]